MDKKNKETRPPIVTILGHVDHGKTTLLDRIRKTDIAGGESGGITQKIGAYTVDTPKSGEITFIDTPGHEAFSAMRGRGAQVADIVILVVAANEGVKPQTRESISLIQNAKVPFIVALTKIDLAAANVEQVKRELVSLGLSLEGQGGDIPVVPVSAKTGEGIPDLLEMISLVSEVHGIKSNPQDNLDAVVIESRHDRRQGSLVTAVVRSGKISVGDILRAGKASGKVKAITDPRGKRVVEILPGMAGEILGFSDTAPVGAKVELNREGASDLTDEKIQQTADSRRFNIIIRADTLGSLEALQAFLPQDVGVLSSGIGDVTQNDVMLSSSFSSPIVGFNVKVPLAVAELAQKEGVEIKLFRIIYEIIDWLSVGPTAPEDNEVLGRGEIKAQFPHGKKLSIAGVLVTDGRIAKGDKLRIVRGRDLLAEIRIDSLKKGREDVSKVDKGGECGIIFRSKVDFKIGDVVESIR